MEGVYELSRPSSARRLRIDPAVGSVAGLLLAGLGIGVVGGLAWGMLRPTLVIDAAGAVDEMASDPNAIFATVGWLSVTAAVIGVVLATVAWYQRRRVGYLLWLIAVAVAATFTVIAVGDTVALMQHRGDPTRIAPPLATPAVWVVAPFVAATIYWLRNVMAYLAATERT
ncbi:hypothetical protein [Corynebacterium sp. HMSC29G08]|uniref:hypothetical protein n=1 Tax=Corynebacterium sp. HMSC29G08 TaxID=1581069 RepID=UPI00114C9D21|nr:hypothetical protein [Corynebacterium sp. HMSC29G08]